MCTLGNVRMGNVDSTHEPQRHSLVQRAANYFGMPSRVEFISAAILLALLVALKLLNVRHQSFDRDEPQHLHVIWELTRGSVPYRDFFDNHMPLFHFIFAPIVGLLGERATILYWMRFILLPMYFVVLWCTYEIGSRLFSRRAGLWALIGVGFYRAYDTAIDFRTDNLWVPIWLLCIVVLIRGVVDIRRSLVAGISLGLCFGVSMKSTVLFLSLLASALFTAVLLRGHQSGRSKAYLLRCAGAFLAGAVAIPVTMMIFFARKGIWTDFRYCVFEFNFLANRVYENRVLYQQKPLVAAGILTAALILLVYAARWILRVTAEPSLAARRIFIVLVCASYLLVLQIFWPPTSRTFSPIYPLAFVLLSGGLLDLSEKLWREDWSVFRILRWLPLPMFLAVIELFLPLRKRSIFDDRTTHQTSMLRSLLKLTEPNDYVLDCKGETIFRHRCFRPVLERITMRAIKRGIIVDDAPQRCIETRTCVVATIWAQRYSPATLQFVQRNYLPVGNKLSVAGMVLQPASATPQRYDFEVVIPASYRIIAKGGDVSGMLDGVPYHGAQFLKAGWHSFESAEPSGQLVLLWAQAVERAFAPLE